MIADLALLGWRAEGGGGVGVVPVEVAAVVPGDGERGVAGGEFGGVGELGRVPQVDRLVARRAGLAEPGLVQAERACRAAATARGRPGRCR